MGLALSGLASGFDWKSLVDQLIEASRTPQNRMRTEKSQLATKTSALNDVKSLMTQLKSSVSALSDPSIYQKKSATFKNTATDWTATTTSSTPSGTYKFQFLTEATNSKLLGSAGIANPIDPSGDPSATPPTGTPLSNISAGRTITGGTITVNGIPITIDLTKTLDQNLSAINGSGAGVTADFITDPLDPNYDKITISGPGTISLGAPNDTSNFLQVMRLSSGNLFTASSASLSSPRLTSAINSANLATSPAASGAFKINGTSISWDASSDTLQTVMQRINDSQAGVTATFDLSSGTFQLTNKSTGSTGISVSDDAGGLAAAMGLTTGTPTAGQDATFKINDGGTLTSRSNILDENAHGVTGLSVTANSIGTQVVTVSGDSSDAKTALNSFITNYNAVQAAIDKYTKVTVSGKNVTSAVLAGDSQLAELSRKLRRILYDTSEQASGNYYNPSSAVTKLSDIGIGSSGIENTISLKSVADLDSKLASNPSDVITYLKDTNSNQYGLVDRLSKLVDGFTSDSSTTPGTLSVKLNSIVKQNTSLDNQISDWDRKLESQRALLEASFTAMEKAQSSFQQQGSYLAKTFGSK